MTGSEVDMYPGLNPETVHHYKDRHHAGKVLAEHLAHLAAPHDAVVLAMPNGGVAVGFEVATALRLPLDVVIARRRRMTDVQLGPVTRFERAELIRREREYRGMRPPVPVTGRIVILVDEGLATSESMEAAVKAVRALRPSRVVVAAPVGAPDACRQLLGIADEVVCPLTPRRFGAVGAWYDDFRQTTDVEVRRLLDHVDAPLSWSA
jgi:putative phosphoribosyl transferase